MQAEGSREPADALRAGFSLCQGRTEGRRGARTNRVSQAGAVDEEAGGALSGERALSPYHFSSKQTLWDATLTRAFQGPCRPCRWPAYYATGNSPLFRLRTKAPHLRTFGSFPDIRGHLYF